MKKTLMDETLRQAAIKSGYSQRQLCKAADLERTSIARFMRGEQSLRLDRAAKLADFLGLELKPKTKGTK